MRNVTIIGCGLSGSVVARELADHGYHVTVYDRRSHIGGNMYDYKDEHGILVHKYGPHTFHTKKKELFDYICRYEEWEEYHLTCGAYINGKFTPTPFNFTTIDDYYDYDQAAEIKEHIRAVFPDRPTAAVTEVINCDDPIVSNYAKFLFENDYSLYSAKQWGISPLEIDPSILKRVPLRFSYDVGYFDDKYQVMPRHSYSEFIANLLDSKNINIEPGIEALDHLSISEDGHEILLNGQHTDNIIIYTGALDELFDCEYGELPYRSLRFEWKYTDADSFQPMPVVAYPQAEGYTRITEYKKLPVQDIKGSTYAVEYSLPYSPDHIGQEPYYPILTEDSQNLYHKYYDKASRLSNFFFAGRLGDFKYYNMDQALDRALSLSSMIISKYQ